MYSLSEINFRTVADPAEFCAECDSLYQQKVDKAAELIIENIENSPIVLLSGPSGSGKTTSAMKVCQALKQRGVATNYVSMDNYYQDVGEKTPRTEDGQYDLESPDCLDAELLDRHFTKLSKGETVYIPRFDFVARKRASQPDKAIQLDKNEVCVFEGIHALNPKFTERHPEAFKLYISARSDVEFEGKVVFKRTWFRLLRRMVRDYNFRGSSPEDTMKMWANVRRGEILYISPYKDTANYQFDSSMECEIPVFNHVATELFKTVPEGIERFDELRSVFPALQLFGEISADFVANDSLLREFIGGGVYDY